MANLEVVTEDSFLFQIKRTRIEMKDKFLAAHRELQEREAESADKLQEIEDEYTGSGITEQIGELTKSKNALADALTGNANQEFLNKNLDQVDERINELKQKLQFAKDTYKSVALEWNISITTEVLVNGVARRQATDYTKIDTPTDAFGVHTKHGSSPGTFYCPEGIAIDPATNLLYICDRGNNRVQVFDKCWEFLFLFNEGISDPDGICINQERVYVTQRKTHLLNVYTTEGKYLESVGGKGNRNLEFDTPRGLCVSAERNRIYIAESENHRVHCLNLDLTFDSLIVDLYRARDVKLTPEEIVVLSFQNPCISIFSKSHQLIRKMIPRGKDLYLQGPTKFVLDNSFNILLTDFDAHCVSTYSYRGEFVHTFGKEGRQKGEFIHPKGLTISPSGQIIVISENPDHCVQVFSS